MKIYDISRELLSAPVYPGDPEPKLRLTAMIGEGSDANVSQLSCCVHAGTHVDAPLHYLNGGRSAAQLAPEHFVGPCTVVSVSGLLTGSDAERLLERCSKRILLHGNGTAFLTRSAAFVLADAGVLLVGTDALSIAPPQEETAPHRELLQRGIPILEGLQLDGIADGKYLLSALPLKLAGADGAPVRAVLLETGPGRKE